MTTTLTPSRIRESLRLVRAERARRSLAQFVKYLWRVVEPGRELVWNWHMDVICQELEFVDAGGFVGKPIRMPDGRDFWMPDPDGEWHKVRELVICVPPGAAKSLLVSVMWPCWSWLRRPFLRDTGYSNSDDLVKRDTGRCRDILRSEEYAACREVACRAYNLPMWDFSEDQNEKHLFANTLHGFMYGMPLGGNVTGKRGDRQRVDDPSDAKDVMLGSPAQVAKRMQDVISDWDGVLASRVNDVWESPRVLIAQRLDVGDLPGEQIRRGVRHVVLPMEYDPDHPHRYPDDPRTERGELLFPQRFPQEWVDQEKVKPGSSRWWPAQYNQNPQAKSGGVYRKEWFRYYADDGDYYVLHCALGVTKRVRKDDCWRIIVSDTALSKNTSAAHSVIQVWDFVRHEQRGVGTHDGELSQRTSYAILVDQWRGQVTAPEYEDQLDVMRLRHKVLYVALESVTASLPIIQRFSRDGIAIKKINPKDYGGTTDHSKYARANAASIHMEEGKVFFPQSAPFLTDLENELLDCPGAVWDQIDTTSYGILIGYSRDSWMEPAKKPYRKGTLGDIAGHMDAFDPEPELPDPFKRR